jgi:hypothetical protein
MSNGTPQYTREDMMKLAEMSEENTVPKVYLEEFNYDPVKFRALLEEYNLKSDIYYLYEYPHDELGLLVNQSNVNGYLRFRLSIDK